MATHISRAPVLPVFCIQCTLAGLKQKLSPLRTRYFFFANVEYYVSMQDESEFFAFVGFSS